MSSALYYQIAQMESWKLDQYASYSELSTKGFTGMKKGARVENDAVNEFSGIWSVEIATFFLYIVKQRLCNFQKFLKLEGKYFHALTE